MTGFEPVSVHGGVRRRRLGPGERIRVLVVDDSVVARRMAAEAIEAEPRIEVVGVAATGAIALAKVEQHRPHVVTLDVEMPGMDGLETLGRLRTLAPDVVVIMLSSLTRAGAEVALAALDLGAADYLAKPSTGSREESLERLRAELIPKVMQFFSWEAGVVRAPASPALASPAVTADPARRTPEVLAIGVSTGGPNALPVVLSALPERFPLPVLIVQHMPPVFTRLLADRLNASSPLEVREAADGDEIRPGLALLAPGDFHLEAVREGGRAVARIHQGVPENSCRPAVDVLFRSVERVWGGAAAAVVLTGMGNDGLNGTRVLRGAGAVVIAQDEPTSVVWGMPGAVVREGLASAVVPLGEVAPAILASLAPGRFRWPA
jgi:two-component system chemotaxis response regulator CheB